MLHQNAPSEQHLGAQSPAAVTSSITAQDGNIFGNKLWISRPLSFSALLLLLLFTIWTSTRSFEADHLCHSHCQLAQRTPTPSTHSRRSAGKECWAPPLKPMQLANPWTELGGWKLAKGCQVEPKHGITRKVKVITYSCLRSLCALRKNSKNNFTKIIYEGWIHYDWVWAPFPPLQYERPLFKSEFTDSFKASYT